MDNMLDISREAFPNPALARLSSVLHESESATQKGIDRAFPASLTGLAEHAKRGHNAEEMLEHFQTGDYPHLAPAEVAPLIKDPVQTARLAAAGEGFLSQIFGSRLDEVVDLVARQAGVSRTSAHVILGLSAPLLLDAVSKESAIRHLDADGLSRFLSDQEERAHSISPGVVDDAASAAGSPAIQAGRDVAGPPLFARGQTVSSPLSSAAYVSSGIPLSQVHGQTTVEQAPTLDEHVEEHFGEPSKLARGLMWLLAALAIVTLISWGLMRLAPKPQPETPRLPANVGTSQPDQARGAATSLPGGVNTATPAEATGMVREGASESAAEAAINAEKPAAVPRSVNAPHVPALPTTAPNVTGGVATADRAATGATSINQPSPRLAGEEAVRALKKTPPAGPRADRVQAVSPPPADTSALGNLETRSVSSLDESGRTDGIVESQRTATPMALAGSALPDYFERGALPPRRFIVSDLSFAPNSAELSRDSRVLDRVASSLRNHPGASVLIEGRAHRVSGAANEELSKERAQAVKDYLVERGVPASRLKTAGMADARPSKNPDSVDFVVLSR